MGGHTEAVTAAEAKRMGIDSKFSGVGRCLRFRENRSNALPSV